MKRTALFLILALCMPALAQEEPQASWKRTEEPTPQEFRLFHSDMAFNLPTAETLHKKEMQFEIAHRFEEPIQTGHETYYGLDSHVHMRLALGYALTDRFTITAARSNAYGNVDLRFKYKFLEWKGAVPMMMAAQGGAGWNSILEEHQQQPGTRSSINGYQMQYYGSVIFNTLLWKRLGLGLVPSYVTNSDLFDPSNPDSFSVGGYAQYYLGRSFSVLAEMNHQVSGYDRGHDPVAVGVEFETGGHFFKIMVTNSMYLNPSTYLAGSDFAFADDEWRFGFIITRLLKFGSDSGENTKGE